MRERAEESGRRELRAARDRGSSQGFAIRRISPLYFAQMTLSASTTSDATLDSLGDNAVVPPPQPPVREQ
jgi:hypothetical protein